MTQVPVRRHSAKFLFTLSEAAARSLWQTIHLEPPSLSSAISFSVWRWLEEGVIDSSRNPMECSPTGMALHVIPPTRWEFVGTTLPANCQLRQSYFLAEV
jgi:hypothetical protein